MNDMKNWHDGKSVAFRPNDQVISRFESGTYYRHLRKQERIYNTILINIELLEQGCDLYGIGPSLLLCMYQSIVNYYLIAQCHLVR